MVAYKELTKKEKAKGEKKIIKVHFHFTVVIAVSLALTDLRDVLQHDLALQRTKSSTTEAQVLSKQVRLRRENDLS